MVKECILSCKIVVMFGIPKPVLSSYLERRKTVRITRAYMQDWKELGNPLTSSDKH